MILQSLRERLRRRRQPTAPGAARQAGKIGWLLLWLIGIPVPLLIVLFLLRGCT